MLVGRYLLPLKYCESVKLIRRFVGRWCYNPAGGFRPLATHLRSRESLGILFIGPVVYRVFHLRISFHCIEFDLERELTSCRFGEQSYYLR